MSLFMGGINSMEVDPEKIRLAEAEFASYVTLYTDIIDNCHKKCLPRYYSDEELPKGELVCVDRCAAKFFRANMVVGEYMRSISASPTSMASASATLNTLGQHQDLPQGPSKSA